MTLYVVMLLITINGGSQLEVTVPQETHDKVTCNQRGPVFARAVLIEYREYFTNVQWKCVRQGDAI